MYGEKTAIYRNLREQIPSPNQLSCELELIRLVYEGESVEK